MSITFYFKNDILYIRADGNECSMVDYSNQVWNECVAELMIFGIQKDTLGKCATNYGIHISEIKKYAKPFGDLGIKIIKEITRIATKHLTFVMNECEKLTKQNKNKSGFMIVETEILK
jgi:hypothetical protein